MQTSPLRRRIGFVTVLAMALSMLAAGPSFAAEPTGTAAIVSARDVLAGGQAQEFTIQVDYPQGSLLDGLSSGSKAPVDVVQIVPPRNVVTGPQGDTPGWEYQVKENTDNLFFFGSQIDPGSSAAFTFTADVAAPPEDILRDFKVFLSDDEGQTFTQADPSSNGALTTAVRVLGVKSVELVAPGGATDYTVTTDQDNVVARVTVANYGAPSGTGRTGLTVQPTVTGATTTTPAATDIPYGSSAAFDVTATMPSQAADIALFADATATDANADALGRSSDTIHVVQKLGLTYQGGTLDPRNVIGAAVPGAPSYAFTATLARAGDVSAIIDTGGTTFDLDTFSSSATQPTQVAATDDTVGFQFAASQVALDDGSYQPAIHVTGTDENGAPVDLQVPVGDTVKVDTDVPVVGPLLTGTASNLDDPDPGEEQVTEDGATITYGGNVNDSTGADCTDCHITGAHLVQLDGALATIGQNLPATVTMDGSGNLSGSDEPQYAAATRYVRLVVSVADAAGLTSTGTSDPIVVDNIAPAFAGGITGQTPDVVPAADRPDPNRTITVSLSESVTFSPDTSASDWYVDGRTVTDVAAYRDTGEATPGHADLVVLTVDSDLDPNQPPAVRYQPPAPLDANRGQDQMSHDLADQAITVVDGIVPPPADLARVHDRVRQDGEFWSGGNKPTFEFRNIAVGDTIKLYEVTDGGSTLIEQETQQADSGVITLNRDGAYQFAAGDGEVATVAAKVLDGAGNASELARFDVHFDFTAPTLTQAAQNGRDVTVTLSEPLSSDPAHRGRDNASDWAAQRGSGYLAETYAATSVSSSGDTIQVTMEQQAANAALETILYEFSGIGSGTRYEDRAGNVLVDSSQPVS